MYLIDTSVWIHGLRPQGSAAVQIRMKPIVASGEAGITEWIILELMTGLRTSERKETLLERLEPVTMMSFEHSHWKMAWDNAARLRKRGVSASAADCLIATVALVNGVELIHCDPDFEDMKPVLGLRTVDWTKIAGQP